MTAEAARANLLDLHRLAYLEFIGRMPYGVTMCATIAMACYIERIVWLKLRRELPGAPPYPGPRQA